VLKSVMLNGVGEGERLCPKFPLTPPSHSPRRPSFSNYSCASEGGERCVHRPSHARLTAFNFLLQREREGDRSFLLSPSRSACLPWCFCFSGSVKGNCRTQVRIHAAQPCQLRLCGIWRDPLQGNGQKARRFLISRSGLRHT